MIEWSWIGHALEVASVIMFGWCWLETRRFRAGWHTELAVAFYYGCVLEILDMRVFGTYHYGRLTWWWVGELPLYIPLLWAIILHSSMVLSDRSGLPPWARPFLDALLAVLIDLAIDAIAVRVGLWNWGISLHEGWFGVPAGNLYAWMWVATWYSAITRLVRRRIATRNEPRWHQFLVPVVAYTGLLMTLILIGSLARWLGLERPNERLWLFAAHLLVFAAIVVRAARSRSRQASGQGVARSLLISRWIMHLSFVMILMVGGIWRQTPALMVVCLMALAAEGSAQRWSELRVKTT